MINKFTKNFKTGLKSKHNAYGYLFVAPWILGFVFLFIIPFVQSVIFSFNQIILTGDESGFYLNYVGTRKYTDLFLVHPDFRQILVSAISEMITIVPLVVFFSLFAALMINQKFKGRTLVRAIFFLPVILGSGVVLMLQQYPWLESVLGGANSMSSSINDVKGSQLLIKYITEVAGSFNLPVIDKVVDMTSSIRQIIQSSGVQILIFLAGLQSIPASMYEAAKIEGSTAWESFWKITLPLLSPVIFVNVIYTVIDTFTSNYNIVMTLIRKTAFTGQADLSSSAAMAMVYFLVVSLFLLVFTLISSRLIYRQD